MIIGLFVLWFVTFGFVIALGRLANAQHVKVQQLEKLNDHWAKKFEAMLEVAGEFQPGKPLYGVLTMGDDIIVKGFRWAVDEAIKVREQAVSTPLVAPPAGYGEQSLKPNDRVVSRWGVKGIVVKVGNVTATLRVDGGGYPAIIPLDSLRRLTQRG